MYSKPVIRKLLFFLSLFYGLQGDFVSERSEVQIDLAQQSFAIMFSDLQIPENQAELAAKDFTRLDTANNRLARTPEFELDTFHLFEAAGQLNAQLKLSFSSRENLFEVLNFKNDKDGTMTFTPLEQEKVSETNGTLDAENKGAAVRWQRGTEVLKLSVTRLPGKEPADSTISLLPAWKDWKKQ